jgi:hypothetical protein
VALWWQIGAIGPAFARKVYCPFKKHAAGLAGRQEFMTAAEKTIFLRNRIQIK